MSTPAEPHTGHKKEKPGQEKPARKPPRRPIMNAHSIAASVEAIRARSEGSDEQRESFV